MELIKGKLYYIPYGSTTNKGNPKDLLGLGIFLEHGTDKYGEFWKFKDKIGTIKKDVVYEYRAYGKENIEYVNREAVSKEFEKMYYEICPWNKPKEQFEDLKPMINSVKDKGKIESVLKFIRQTFNYEDFEEKYEKLSVEYNLLLKENKELIENVKNLENFLEEIYNKIGNKLLN